MKKIGKGEVRFMPVGSRINRRERRILKRREIKVMRAEGKKCIESV